MREYLLNNLRSILYPGLDLHVRDRGRLAQYWKTGARDVLDAGSGNGYFSWLAYRSGARVVALNFEKEQVEKARGFLVGHRKADPQRLTFECANLYDLPKERRLFDEIICFEVLEHIRNDAAVLKEFHRILKPGGYLHLCCPYRMHPRHQAEVLDVEEKGGHVRAGYTEEDYRRLLEPLGFRIDTVRGLGTRGVYLADAIMRKLRGTLGDVFALPLLPFGLPVVWASGGIPKVPFSLYVRAVKPDGVR